MAAGVMSRELKLCSDVVSRWMMYSNGSQAYRERLPYTLDALLKAHRRVVTMPLTCRCKCSWLAKPVVCAASFRNGATGVRTEWVRKLRPVLVSAQMSVQTRPIERVGASCA